MPFTKKCITFSQHLQSNANTTECIYTSANMCFSFSLSENATYNLIVGKPLMLKWAARSVKRVQSTLPTLTGELRSS